MNKFLNLIGYQGEFQIAVMINDPGTTKCPVRSEGFLTFRYFQIKQFAANSPIHLHLEAVRH